MEHQPGDCLRIQELEVSVRIGVTAEERANPQAIELNVSVWPKTTFDQLGDNIEQAVNYVELDRATRDFVQGREWKLIETLSAELAYHLAAEFPVAAAEVEVRKFVLSNTDHVAATARRCAIG